MPGAPVSPPRRLGSFTLGAVLVAVSMVTALNYAWLPGRSALDSRRVIHRTILEQTASPPDRYRFLVPVILEAPIAALSGSMPKDVAFDRAYAVFYVVAMVTLLWSLFGYVRVWFTDGQALAGALFVATTLPITTRQHDYAPYSLLEPTFVALALLCILKNRRLLLGLVIAVATFNRETAVFIVLLYAIAQPLTKSRLYTTAAYAAIWGTVFLGVRLFAGDADPYWTIDKIFVSNLFQPWLALFNITALFGVFWWFAIAGIRKAPPFVRRTALVIPPYLAVVAIWSIWREVRLLLPLMPILLPLALAYLFEPRSSANGTAATLAGR